MRLLFKYFFKTIHYIVGPVILLWDWLFPPQGIARPAAEQLQVDSRTRNLVLYQFLMCPFCVSVRRAIKRLSLDIETRDALRDPSSRKQLLANGGKIQVPCLKISDAQGNVTWMYESRDIIQYLQQEFA
jgi:glutaredoxin